MNKSAVVRMILCVATAAIIIMGMLGVLPKKITVPAAYVLLFIIAVWNGVSAIKNKRTVSAVTSFVVAAVTILLMVFFCLTKL